MLQPRIHPWLFLWETPYEPLLLCCCTHFLTDGERLWGHCSYLSKPYKRISKHQWMRKYSFPRGPRGLRTYEVLQRPNTSASDQVPGAQIGHWKWAPLGVHPSGPKNSPLFTQDATEFALIWMNCTLLDGLYTDLNILYTVKLIKPGWRWLNDWLGWREGPRRSSNLPKS